MCCGRVRAIAVAKVPQQQQQSQITRKHIPTPSHPSSLRHPGTQAPAFASTTPKNMKNLIFLLCCCALLHFNGSAVAKPAPHGIKTTTTTSTTGVVGAPTYTVAVTPVVTAHSHQVVARHYNGGLYVPAGYVPTAYPYTYAALYPYSATSYRYGYGYYPAYGYSYGYGTAVPTALWR